MRRTTVIVSGAVAAALIAGVVATAAALPTADAQHPAASKAASTPSAAPPLSASATSAASAPAACSQPTATVATASRLSKALGSAKPGGVILLKAGTYRGQFTLKTDGVTVCGDTGAIVDGGGTSRGYGFHVDGADHAVLSGFTVRDAQKGVMVDDAQDVTVIGLTVTRIGDEGIHVRDNSSGARILDNRISDTGNRVARYGEGIYIGTAKSNWCDISDCKPDASDGAVVRGNTISDTTAESVDIKEGTTGGTLAGNSFDGSSSKAADSWVDVKGNDWTITGNTGVHSSGDGFQTHQIVDGWGTGNHFTDNTATVDGDGYGFHLAPVLDNSVACDNTASQAAKGLANIPCASP